MHYNLPPQQQPVNMKKTCMDHIHRYVLLKTIDGKSFDGIVEHVDDTNVYIAVPSGMPVREGGSHEEEMSRNQDSADERVFYPGIGNIPGYGGFPYGYPGYGYWYGYGYPGYGYAPGRFQRLVLPLTALAALSLLPYY